MMLKSNLCNYSDVYTLVKGTITVPNMATASEAKDNANKKIKSKNCAPFTDCIRKINNTQEDNAKDNDVVIPIYNLIEYSANYLKTSGSL